MAKHKSIIRTEVQKMSFLELTDCSGVAWILKVLQNLLLISERALIHLENAS